MNAYTPYIKRLLIECPVPIKQAFQAPDREFETFQGVHYLRLTLDRDYYTPTKTYGSGSAGWNRTFSTPTFTLRAYERGISLQIPDQRLFFYDILQEISRQSTTPDLRRKRTIKLVDFILPESADRMAAIAAVPQYEPFTVRFGTLSEPKANGGSVGLGMTGAWIKGGCAVQFLEAGLRYE